MVGQGFFFEKVDPKLSNSQPQLKFADAYKKKRVFRKVYNLSTAKNLKRESTAGPFQNIFPDF